MAGEPSHKATAESMISDGPEHVVPPSSPPLLLSPTVLQGQPSSSGNSLASGMRDHPVQTQHLEDVTHQVLPIIFFLLFFITGTIVLIYSLAEHQTIPSRLAIGIAGAMGFILSLWWGLWTLSYWRRRNRLGKWHGTPTDRCPISAEERAAVMNPAIRLGHPERQTSITQLADGLIQALNLHWRNEQPPATPEEGQDLAAPDNRGSNIVSDRDRAMVRDNLSSRWFPRWGARIDRYAVSSEARLHQQRPSDKNASTNHTTNQTGRPTRSSRSEAKYSTRPDPDMSPILNSTPLPGPKLSELVSSLPKSLQIHMRNYPRAPVENAIIKNSNTNSLQDPNTIAQPSSSSRENPPPERFPLFLPRSASSGLQTRDMKAQKNAQLLRPAAAVGRQNLRGRAPQHEDRNTLVEQVRLNEKPRKLDVRYKGNGAMEKELPSIPNKVSVYVPYNPNVIVSHHEMDHPSSSHYQKYPPQVNNTKRFSEAIDAGERPDAHRYDATTAASCQDGAEHSLHHTRMSFTSKPSEPNPSAPSKRSGEPSGRQNLRRVNRPGSRFPDLSDADIETSPKSHGNSSGNINTNDNREAYFSRVDDVLDGHTCHGQEFNFRHSEENTKKTSAQIGISDGEVSEDRESAWGRTHDKRIYGSLPKSDQAIANAIPPASLTASNSPYPAYNIASDVNFNTNVDAITNKIANANSNTNPNLKIPPYTFLPPFSDPKPPSIPYLSPHLKSQEQTRHPDQSISSLPLRQFSKKYPTIEDIPDESESQLQSPDGQVIGRNSPATQQLNHDLQDDDENQEAFIRRSLSWQRKYDYRRAEIRRLEDMDKGSQ